MKVLKVMVIKMEDVLKNQPDSKAVGRDSWTVTPISLCAAKMMSMLPRTAPKRPSTVFFGLSLGQSSRVPKARPKK